MTKEEIAILGHAFFDGKTLQYKGEEWYDWKNGYCPTFFEAEWRIKPKEPKKAVVASLLCDNGTFAHALTGSKSFNTYIVAGWKHVPELDREVTLPFGNE